MDLGNYIRNHPGYRSRLRGGKKVKPSAWGIAYHGNYVGPGWSAGKYQNSVVSDVPPIDEFDATAKRHDEAYAKGEDLVKADAEFAKVNIGKGFKRTAAGLAVGAQGKIREVMGKQKFRGDVDMNEVAKRLKHIKKQGLEGIGAHAAKPALPTSGIFNVNTEVNTPWAMTPPGSPPQSNLHRSINSGKHGMTKRTGTDGDEVPVIPPPKKLSKIHPDYFTVNLPFVHRTWSNNEANFTYNVANPWAIIRLNSIYDPLKEINATTGNPLIESDNQPQGRAIWESHFKYYRVLRAYVKLTFVSERHVCVQGRPFNEHYVVGYELVDEDAQISNHVDMFLMTKHAKRSIIKPVNRVEYVNTYVEPTNITTKNQSVNSLTMTYVYEPSNWNYHVEELGSEERWTPIKQNPSIDHDMAIRIMHLDQIDPTFGQIEAVGCLIQISYDVQFREATDSFFKTLNFGGATYGGAGEDPADD
jgi:hypothetical protein